MVEFIPILRSDLNEYREELHDRIILSAISKIHKKNITIDEINEAINRLFSITYPKERLFYHIKRSLKSGVRFNNDNVILSDEPIQVNKDLSTLIHECFNEFIPNIVRDYDQYIHKKFFDAFVELSEFSAKIIMESLRINEVNFDIIDLKANDVHMRGIISSFNIKEVDKYIDAYYRYLLSESLYKNNYIMSCYQCAISLDIFKRSSDLYRYSRAYSEKNLLVIDTNIITALLLSSNRYHDTVVSMMSLSKKFGFEIYYTYRTKKEFEHLIAAANYSMKQRKSITHSDRNNELITDYLKINNTVEYQNWSDILMYYYSFESQLRDNFGIDLLDEKIQSTTSDLGTLARDVYEIVTRSKERLNSAIEHDIELLNLMEGLKTPKTIKLFDSPWILTLDNILLYVDDYINRKRNVDYTFCIHAQKWFNLLIPFCDIEDIRENENMFASAIVKYSIVPIRTTLTLEEYSKLLADKFGMEGADSQIIFNIITKSKLKPELEKNLSDDDLEAIRDTTYLLFSDEKLLEDLLEKKKDKMTIGRLKDSIKKERLENELLRSQNAIYKEFIELNGKNYEKLILRIDELINILIKEDPQFFDDTGIEKPDIKTQERTSIIFRLAPSARDFIN
ncbi:MAG: hypothetical protein ACOWWR_05475, partial [Eubacteriales bacterium]